MKKYENYTIFELRELSNDEFDIVFNTLLKEELLETINGIVIISLKGTAIGILAIIGGFLISPLPSYAMQKDLRDQAASSMTVTNTNQANHGLEETATGESLEEINRRERKEIQNFCSDSTKLQNLPANFKKSNQDQHFYRVSGYKILDTELSMMGLLYSGSKYFQNSVNFSLMMLNKSQASAQNYFDTVKANDVAMELIFGKFITEFSIENPKQTTVKSIQDCFAQLHALHEDNQNQFLLAMATTNMAIFTTESGYLEYGQSSLCKPPSNAQAQVELAVPIKLYYKTALQHRRTIIEKGKTTDQKWKKTYNPLLTCAQETLDFNNPNSNICDFDSSSLNNEDLYEYL